MSVEKLQMEDSAADAYLVQNYDTPQLNACAPHPLSCALACIFPCSLCAFCYSVAEQEDAVLLYWGKLGAHETSPGLHCANPCGRNVIKISKRQISRDISQVKVIDKNGNPLIISGVVRYYFNETIRTALEVTNGRDYVEHQATAVLKQVISRYPYESEDGSICLMTEAEEVGEQMVELLQSRVHASGAVILSMQLNQISFSPEISGAMLKKQQAHALIEARQTLVNGAIAVAVEAVHELNDMGHQLDEGETASIVSNILVSMTSESEVVPVITMNTNFN